MDHVRLKYSGEGLSKQSHVSSQGSAEARGGLSSGNEDERLLIPQLALCPPLCVL